MGCWLDGVVDVVL